MQIVRNSTGLAAGLTAAVDKHGREHCVVAVRGTFAVDADGEPTLAEEQLEPVAADEHYGDPAETAIRYECDYALTKPRVDVLVVGSAFPPSGGAAEQVDVELRIGPIRKRVRVTGDRRWERSLLGLRISDPEPFESMPLVYHRAFGGTDQTHPKPKRQGAELRNPIGVGFHRNSDSDAIAGTPLPNLEDPRRPIRKWSDAPEPTGLGVLGRGWQQRLQFAGTYDQAWMDGRFPFLPEDFDDRYFQAAPLDQQLDRLVGGEVVECDHMTPTGSFRARVPELNVPVRFKFRGEEVVRDARADTLVIEPDASRLIVTWRASAPLGRRATDLRGVVVGQEPRPRRSTGKRRFDSLEDLIADGRERAAAGEGAR